MTISEKLIWHGSIKITSRLVLVLPFLFYNGFAHFLTDDQGLLYSVASKSNLENAISHFRTKAVDIKTTLKYFQILFYFLIS